MTSDPQRCKDHVEHLGIAQSFTCSASVQPSSVLKIQSSVTSRSHLPSRDATFTTGDKCEAGRKHPLGRAGTNPLYSPEGNLHCGKPFVLPQQGLNQSAHATQDDVRMMLQCAINFFEAAHLFCNPKHPYVQVYRV